MLTVLKNMLKKIGEKLGLVSPAVPKQVQVRILNPDVAHGAPLMPKAIVCVVNGSPKDNWIKNYEK